MQNGRVLALDYGSVRIGIALSDELRITAQPLTTLPNEGINQNCAAIKQIIDEHAVTQLVMGLPKRLDGSHGDMAEEAKRFSAQLKEQCAIPIRFWDERYSSQAVDRVLLQGNVRRSKRKKVRDQSAAVWILQGFLDAQP